MLIVMWLFSLLRAFFILSAQDTINRSDENVTDINIVSRDEWLATPSGEVNKLLTPVPMVIICQTATDHCFDRASCTFIVRFIQTFHVESRQWADIGYNFLIGGDGSIYEGRGWNTVGSHTKNYNNKSLGIAFIGTFNEKKPTDKQLKALESLLKYGVTAEMISKNYKLYGQRQLIPTLSPGDAVFEELKTWPHFSNEV